MRGDPCIDCNRIAAGIQKRVGELLPTSASAPAASATPRGALPEAPASVNVRLHLAAREVQWTLRDTDEARLATRLEALLARYPAPQPKAQGKDWCGKHSVTMRWNEGKEGKRGWYSHKTPDGWCKGR